MGEQDNNIIKNKNIFSNNVNLINIIYEIF